MKTCVRRKKVEASEGEEERELPATPTTPTFRPTPTPVEPLPDFRTGDESVPSINGSNPKLAKYPNSPLSPLTRTSALLRPGELQAFETPTHLEPA